MLRNKRLVVLVSTVFVATLVGFAMGVLYSSWVVEQRVLEVTPQACGENPQLKEPGLGRPNSAYPYRDDKEAELASRALGLLERKLASAPTFVGNSNEKVSIDLHVQDIQDEWVTILVEQRLAMESAEPGFITDEFQVNPRRRAVRWRDYPQEGLRPFADFLLDHQKRAQLRILRPCEG